MMDDERDEPAGTRPVALLTGASRGLGEVLARFLAGSGHDLVLVARGAKDLAASADAARSFGGRVVTVAGDVAQAADRAEMVAAAAGLGRLDVLVNNASTLGATPLRPLVDYPLAALREALEVNVVAPLGLVQAARSLLAASRGLVVNVSSDAAIGGYEGWGGYGAGKAALDLLSRTLAAELRPEGIAVVSVDPGDMRTAMNQAAYPGEDISDRPLPEATLPFWAWLFGQDRAAISGGRFEAQAEQWLLPA